MRFLLVFAAFLLSAISVGAETITDQEEADFYYKCEALEKNFDMGYTEGYNDQKVNVDLLKCAEQASVKYPDRIWPLQFKRSSFTIMNKKCLEALKEIQQKLPNDPNSYSNIGLWYLRNKTYSEAIVNFKKAMEIDPKGCHGGNLGETYMMLGSYDKAIQEFTKHLKLCPDDSLSYEMLARCYFKKGDLKKAKDNFLRSCEMGNEFSCKQLKAVNEKKKLYLDSLLDQ